MLLLDAASAPLLWLLPLLRLETTSTLDQSKTKVGFALALGVEGRLGPLAFAEGEFLGERRRSELSVEIAYVVEILGSCDLTRKDAAASGASHGMTRAPPNVSSCEGFRMTARHGRSVGHRGRRPKASRGGNRGNGHVWGAARAMGIWARH
ncbi:MAG TPA: hypothetical protein VE909_08755, partial [Xanthobacteraceae bacterium]|nr:hypothetical protein [Xanthobacteraceae bacterium]